jgi:lipoate-protein ligase B
MHGFSLNVQTDLGYYRDIVPCGIADKGVTSLHLLVSGVTMDMVKASVVRQFPETFGYPRAVFAGAQSVLPKAPAVSGGSGE